MLTNALIAGRTCQLRPHRRDNNRVLSHLCCRGTLVTWSNMTKHHIMHHGDRYNCAARNVEHAVKSSNWESEVSSCQVWRLVVNKKNKKQKKRNFFRVTCVENILKQLPFNRVGGFWNQASDLLAVKFRRMRDNNNASNHSVMVFASESDATKVAKHIRQLYHLDVVPQSLSFKYCTIHQTVHPFYFFQVNANASRMFNFWMWVTF